MNDTSIFRQVMGSAFADLDPVVQRFHSVNGEIHYHGEVVVDGAESWLGQWIAWLGHLPPAADRMPFEFSIDASHEREIWTRRFAGKDMRSVLSVNDSQLVERLGVFRLRFLLVARNGCLQMQLLQVTAFGIPCPRWLFPRVFAEERGGEDAFHFDIRVTMALVGRVVGYRGFLVMQKEGSRT